MEFGVLGPLRVVEGDREILLRRQKHRALLAFLVLHLGEVVSVDRLLDELWGERPPATAKNSLQNCVSQLRRLLGADVLRTQPPGYVLDVAPSPLSFGDVPTGTSSQRPLTFKNGGGKNISTTGVPRTARHCR